MSFVTQPSLGQVVKSNAGRDAGMFYLVIRSENKNVFLTDGRIRRFENPKKKNIRHVKVYQWIAEAAAEKLKNGQQVTNEEVRRAIAECISNIL